MRSFNQDGPPSIAFSMGAEGRAARRLADLGARRVLLVCQPTHTEGAERLAADLGDRSVGIWSQATPQVPRESVDDLCRRVDETEADWLLAHGGGTPIGVCKAVALTRPVRIGAVPTTYSGSEMTSIWGISSGGSKQTGRDERARPSLVVYDPELLLPLRKEVRQNSLFNALAHSIDALFDPSAPEHVHDDAEASIRALVAGLAALHADSASAEGVSEALYGAHLAGSVLDRAQMSLQHKLAHVLGGSFGTPHAATHAVLLPHTTAYNQLASPTALRRLQRALDHPDPASKLFQLAKHLEIPRRLADLGFRREHIAVALDAALERQYANPRVLTRSGLEQLLSAAVHGREPRRELRSLPLAGCTGLHDGLTATLTGARQPRGVLIAVHGRGSTAEAMLDAVRSPGLPSDLALLAPQADHNSWYPKGFQDREANAPALASALTVLDACFEAARRYVPADRIGVVGFSQGACLALTWLSTRAASEKPGFVVAWTGALLPSFVPASLPGVQVRVSTARSDPWVPLSSVRDTVRAFEDAGARVDLQLAPGDDHLIRPQDHAALRHLLESTMIGDDLDYLTGYGNALCSEALPGALPAHQNTPRNTAYGLHAEQISGTGFTVNRAHNHRVWLYRLRPQLAVSAWKRLDSGHFAGSFDEGVCGPELLRFAPQPYPEGDVDFLAGLTTFAGAGDPCARSGFAIHLYATTCAMERAFSNADGDLLVVPQDGALRIQTELGWLHVRPGEIAILPRGIQFRVEVPDSRSRGFVGEVFNGHFELPERGLIGANGLADERHFKAPVAAWEDVEGPYRVVVKQGGVLWARDFPASPFDVVAWHGSYAPFKYDLMDFNSYWGVNWDHSDPSVLTVLTVPYDGYGRGAVDFAVFRGRWDATEHTLRPPFLHRNSAIEFNAVIKSPATSGPYVAGAMSYTPYLSPHGVSAQSYERATTGPEPGPHRHSDEELWVQFESTYPLRVMPWMLVATHRDPTYLDAFADYERAPLKS